MSDSYFVGFSSFGNYAYRQGMTIIDDYINCINFICIDSLNDRDEIAVKNMRLVRP